MSNPLGAPKTFISTDYATLERVLLEHFPGVQPELHAREEWGNDQQHVFTVAGELDAYDSAKLDDYISGKWTRYGTTQVLLNALCLRGVIDAGEYLVDVTW